MGYIRGVIHGTVIGTVVGLCVAPQEGTRTRAQLQRAFAQTRSTVQKAQETARTLAPVAQSAARTVVEAVEKRRSHAETEPYVSVNGGGNGSPGAGR